jgi:Cu/Ag efflux protein CusF
MKTRRSFGMLLLVAAIVAALPIVWTVQVQAQGAQQQVQGAIKSVDAAGRMLTLEDGTTLTIPPMVGIPPDLKEGAIVKASFEEKDGQKVVTSLEVQQP